MLRIISKFILNRMPNRILYILLILALGVSVVSVYVHFANNGDVTARIRSSYGEKQGKLLSKNMHTFLDRVDKGRSKEEVLEVIGPPDSLSTSHVWVYPKYKEDTNPKDRAYWYCIIFQDGKVLNSIFKSGMVTFEERFAYM